MLESTLKKKCLQYLKKQYPNAFIVKLSDQWISGLPDIWMVKCGYTYCFELKTDKGVVSPIQKATLEKLAKAGAFVRVIRSLEELKEFV